ncbi:MAG: HEAT repeat domain-containing protein [Phycisphaerales bacterium]|nr:HEAT repeat domain-containing protein [Phycisphaerales bacterium]
MTQPPPTPQIHQSTPARSPNRASFGLVILAGIFIATTLGCGTMGNAPRGAKSLRDIMAPQTSPTTAAILATDQYSAENRYRGTTMLAAAPFGGEPIYLELYIDGTDDEDPGVRATCIRALGRHGDPVHASYLIEALNDDDRKVRIAAARALQRVHTREAIPSLIRVINQENEPNADVRAGAADALGQYREPYVVQSLIAALRDTRLVVNNRVQHSLKIMTGQDFGIDLGAWQHWYKSTDDLFAAGQIYTYPVFNRKKRIVEYLPFMGSPPNETTSTPVGLNPTDD